MLLVNGAGRSGPDFQLHASPGPPSAKTPANLLKTHFHPFWQALFHRRAFFHRKILGCKGRATVKAGPAGKTTAAGWR
jgi:hypothetical protein